jgi:hypothetical protein
MKGKRYGKQGYNWARHKSVRERDVGVEKALRGLGYNSPQSSKLLRTSRMR